MSIRLPSFLRLSGTAASLWALAAACPAQAQEEGEARVHPEGFSLERIHQVEASSQGSWVSMAVDGQGRLYCSDQGGKGIFRLTLQGGRPAAVERVPAEISSAHGMLWAFDSLYVVVNGGGIGGHGSGLYRLTDSDGDGQLDSVRRLRSLQGGGEHGPHAVELSPDGRSLYVLGGNHTRIPDPETWAVPPAYAEDQLLPRMPDARGHARSIRAPGGWIARTDPEGASWHLYSAGFRNQYDIAFNADGEMFTYDSDMEWDSGTPWYRPTRIYHCTSGSEFGWRTGTGKFPSWYPDTLPPALDVGPGSPTGMVSGLKASFPERYRRALYAFDWTYGTIYAIHLSPRGSSYSAAKEEFVTGVPLHVTDGVIGMDGSLYFAVGGRGTPSALYRVSYEGEAPQSGEEAGEHAEEHAEEAGLRRLRKRLESFHGRADPEALPALWPHLGHADRFVRYAARVALEHQPVLEWQERALRETGLRTALSALLALARQGDASLQPLLVQALQRFPFSEMDEEERLESLRVLSLAFVRMGKPDPEAARRLAGIYTAYYPAASDALNRELASLLVYLEDPGVVAKTVPLMSQEAVGPEEMEFDDSLLGRSGRYGRSFLDQKASNPQRQQIHYAYALKNADRGWTPALRRDFFAWFAKARNFKGGASFGGFLDNFRTEALARIADPGEKAEMILLSRSPAPLVPEEYRQARSLEIGMKPGMLFDRSVLEAKAGERVALRVVNNDPTGLMHNFVLCAPGGVETVVRQSLLLGERGIELNYVPEIPEVLAATPQIAPQRQFVLYFQAPQSPGSYPFVCTYPGHGVLMRGVLEVVD